MSFTSGQSRASERGVELSSVPRGWVTLAAIALALAAIVGTGLGVSRSIGARDTLADAGELAPVPNTTLAKALPADSVFDESRIRAIAREEAQAALVHSAPKPKAAPKDDADTDASDGPDAPTATLSIPKTPTLTTVKPTITTSPRSTPSTSTTTNPYPPGLTPN